MALWTAERIEKWLDDNWVLSDVTWARKIVHRFAADVVKSYEEVEKADRDRWLNARRAWKIFRERNFQEESSVHVLETLDNFFMADLWEENLSENTEENRS